MEPLVESLQPLVLLLGALLAIVALGAGTWVFRMRRH